MNQFKIFAMLSYDKSSENSINLPHLNPHDFLSGLVLFYEFFIEMNANIAMKTSTLQNLCEILFEFKHGK